MIHITQVIAYLRSKLPSWRIDGAAEYVAAEDKSRLVLPAMYVMLGNFTANTLAYETYLQEYDERFVILLGLDNTADRTGKYSQDYVLTARRALFTALVNYRIDPDAHAVQYVGDQMVSMDKARYWHKFEFKIIGRLDTTDGAQFELDYFDKLYADWNLTESSETNHPDAQDQIQPLYFIPD